MEIIIFSFNRAMQLSVLIDSVIKYYQSGVYTIDVLYNSSNDEFEAGYTHLKTQLSAHSNIKFHKETRLNNTDWSLSEFTDFYNLKLLVLCPFLRKKKSNFRSLLIDILANTKNELTMFLTDDAMFIRPIIISEENKAWVLAAPKHNQFSFRHAVEVIADAKPTAMGDGYEWRFTDYPTSNHWGYNYSLDAHVYATSAMLGFLKRMTFSNPNTLESSGILHTRKKGLFCNGRCNKNISILSFPINIVQDVFTNEALKADPKLLNKYFVEGYELLLPKVDTIQTFQQYPDAITIQKGAETVELPIK